MRIGLRTIKTALSILLCLFIFTIFKAIELIPNVKEGFANSWYNPFFASLAACYSLQGSKEKSIAQAKNRCIASIIGGLIGIILIFVYEALGGVWPTLASINLLSLNFILPYILISLFSILVISTGVYLRQKQAIFVALLTFLSVTVNPGTLVTNWEFQFGINRILSTIFGVLVALIVNFFHIPRFNNKKEIISLINLDNISLVSNEYVKDYIAYNLNNLKEENIEYSFITKEAPALFINTITNYDIKKPIVCMNNSSIFDINKKEFYDIKYIDLKICLRINECLDKYKITPFINKIHNNVHYIYNAKISNERERIYENYIKNLSYLNYIPLNIYDSKEIVYYTIFEEDDILENIYNDIKDFENIKIVIDYININHQLLKCLRIYSLNINNYELHKKFIYPKLYYSNINKNIIDLSPKEQLSFFRKEFKYIKKIYFKGE